MQVLTLVEEIQHARLELLAINLRPRIGMALLAFPANLKTFLQILALRSAQFLNFLGIGGVSHLLASLCDISPIRLRSCPRERIFLAQRALEELG